LIGTCEDFSVITGKTDCVNKTYVIENMQYLQTVNNYFTMFYNPTAYQATGESLEYNRYFDSNGFIVENLFSKAMYLQQ
jgi:hypothetical protein